MEEANWSQYFEPVTYSMSNISITNTTKTEIVPHPWYYNSTKNATNIFPFPEWLYVPADVENIGRALLYSSVPGIKIEIDLWYETTTWNPSNYPKYFGGSFHWQVNVEQCKEGWHWYLVEGGVGLYN